MPEPKHWSDDVLRFWFAELTEEQWWKSTPDLDAAIRSRFSGFHEAVMAEPIEFLAVSPEWSLAAVIVLDQFSRNIFRKSGRAFAGDAKALMIAGTAIDFDFDSTLDTNQRLFLYMPFQHAEDRAVQVRSVALFTALGHQKSLDAAIKHKAIVDRFGRYPHRNAVLGRADTADEAAYLSGEIERFGQ